MTEDRNLGNREPKPTFLTFKMFKLGYLVTPRQCSYLTKWEKKDEDHDALLALATDASFRGINGKGQGPRRKRIIGRPR